MEEHKCPFSAPLVTRQFGCTHSQEVIHRGGAEINCRNAKAHARCDQLFQHLKAVALPAFGVEDDLLSMPHSVLVKVQYGGLLGLQRVRHGTVQAAERVEDIQALVSEAVVQFGSVADVPCASFLADITGFKPRARRGR
jgi:predicted membrane GTPase involved in stress response